MPVCNCENHLDACVAGIAPIRHVLDGGGCVELGIDVTDSNTLDFETAGGLTATAIIAPDAENILEQTASGLRVLKQAIASHSTYTNFLTSTAAFAIKQSTSLALPSGGTWFVQAWWRAWAEKDTDETSAAGSMLEWHLEIEGVDGPTKQWKWGAQAGLLGHANSRVGLQDYFGRVVNGNQTFNVNIRTARNNAGADNNVQISASRIIAIAFKL